MSHGHATRSTFTFLRVIHFIGFLRSAARVKVIALRKSESRPGARPLAVRLQKAVPDQAKRTRYGLLSPWRLSRFLCSVLRPAAGRRRWRPRRLLHRGVCEPDRR